MIEHLRILYYNVGKRRLVQWSLLNDQGLQDYDVLAVIEPYIYPNSVDNQP